MTKYLRRRYVIVFVFCFIELCSSSAQSGTQKVSGIVGESFTFPAKVLSTGSLMYENQGNVAMVLTGNSKTDLVEKFRDRLQWDNQTGLFIITELKIQDSGEYTVDNSEGQKSVTTFQLTVYNHVAKPTLTVRESCSVLCSVENGRDVILSWYRGNESLNQTSSSDFNTSLVLTLEMKDYNTNYSCVASNPASKETIKFNIEDFCHHPGRQDNISRMFVFPVVACCVALIIVTCAIYLKKKKNLQEREDTATSTRQYDHIEYATVTHSNTTQSQQHSVPELDSSTAPVKLTTVYEELRPLT